MKPLLVKPAVSLKGRVSLLGDKSIAHRSVIVSAISVGRTEIKNFPANIDCLYTLEAFKKLGIKITCNKSHRISVFGKGLYGLKTPKSPIFLGDSGTSLRLLLGVLAGQDFAVTLTAGQSLSQRPMLRVTMPLRMMGAKINAKRKTPAWPAGRQNAKREEHPPITIRGGRLKPIIYKLPVASAQVKSAILLAGLYARGKTSVTEPVRTRDHTERMLRLFGADIKVQQNKVVIKGKQKLVSPGIITIPGDVSSASFFIVLATILPNARILIKNVSLNPTRTGIIKVLKRMGADIKIQNLKSKMQNYEPAGDLTIKSSILKRTVVRREEIPSLIDELPILIVAASLAKGRTVFEGVEELRVKETDRIKSMSENLRKMGADITVLKTAGVEKIVIQGVKELKGNKVRSFGDHRTAMSMVVAGLAAKGRTSIDDITCINKSFPNFLSLLKTLIR